MPSINAGTNSDQVPVPEESIDDISFSTAAGLVVRPGHRYQSPSALEAVYFAGLSVVDIEFYI